MQRLEVSDAVRPLKWPLDVKWLSILREIPAISHQAPNTSYNFLMSLWLIERNHRVKVSGMAGINI
jgi:hypothetical protein